MNQAASPAHSGDSVSAGSNTTVTPQMRKVMEYLSAHGEISDQELQALLEIKRTRAYTLVKQMEEAGLVEVSGRGVRRKIRIKT